MPTSAQTVTHTHDRPNALSGPQRELSSSFHLRVKLTRTFVPYNRQHACRYTDGWGATVIGMLTGISDFSSAF